MAKSANTLAREAFGKRLSALRAQAGVSGRVAARAAGINSGTWTRYEQGRIRPGIDKAPAIARALHIPIAALFDTEDGSKVIAEIRVSPETLQAIREHGTPAVDEAANRIATSLKPRMVAAATPPARAKRRLPQTRTRTPSFINAEARRLRLQDRAAASLRAQA